MSLNRNRDRHTSPGPNSCVSLSQHMFKGDGLGLSRDHVSVLVINTRACPNVQFLLANDQDGYWPPNGTVLGPEESWRDAAVRIIKEWTGIAVAAPSDMLWIHRIEMPGYEEKSTHVLFGIRLSDHPLLNCPTFPAPSTTPPVPGDVGQGCSATSPVRNPASLQWLTVADVTSNVLELRCGFLLLLLKEISGSKAQTLPVCDLHEHTSTKWIRVAEDKDIQSITRELLRAAKFGEEEQRRIYGMFMTRSHPFVCLKKRKFGEFMVELGWPTEQIAALFRSFDSQRRGCLNFKHFMLGLAAVEPAIEHGGTPAEIRCRYIFRYYDSNQDNKISFREFRSMVADIRRCRGQILNPEELQQEAERSAMVFGSESRSTLGLHEFLTAVGQLKFRGTSLLLRSPISVLRFVSPCLEASFSGPGGEGIPLSGSKTSRNSSPIPHSFSGESTSSVPGMMSTHTVPLNVMESPFPLPRTPRAGESFELAAHSVKVKKNGLVVNVSTLWDFEGTEAINGTLNLPRGSSFTRLHSFECFSDSFLPNDILKALRYFEKSIKGGSGNAAVPFTNVKQSNPGSAGKQADGGKASKEAFSWGKEVQKTALAQTILALFNQVENILSQEPRLLTINSPVYVLGDLHGNYEDLMCFEKVLWRLGALLTPASLLFLGDYVDRGAHGLEVIAYLFAQKVVAPHKVFLLRGNHEIRAVQRTFTFYDECMGVFGDALGKQVWEGANRVFDNMPIAAVIDGKIFCVHGGIFPSNMGGGRLESILDIPCPLQEPERESPLAWEIMWNDPVNLDTVWPPEMASQIRQNEGFGHNGKRGTAHIFSEDALSDFLKRNNLSHVIRAHEVQQSGFQIQPSGRCLTVFSSSRYCGASNEAACILCENLKLRVIRLDTS